MIKVVQTIEYVIEEDDIEALVRQSGGQSNREDVINDIIADLDWNEYTWLDTQFIEED